MRNDWIHLKQLFKLVKPWWMHYGMSTIIVSSRNLCINLLVAFLYASTISATRQQNMQLLGQKAGMFLLMLIGFVAMDSVGLYAQSVTIHKMVNHIRYNLFSHIIRVPLPKIESIGNRAEVLSRMNNDISKVESIFRSNILYPLMSLISGVGATISIFSINWVFGLCIYGLGALALTSQIFFSKKLRTTSAKIQRINAQLMIVFNEAFCNSLAIKLMGLAQSIQQRFIKRLKPYDETLHEQALVRAAISESNAVVAVIQYIGVIFLGFAFLIHKAMEIEQILFVAQLSGLITSMFTSLGGALSSLQHAMAGMDRIYEIMDIHEEEITVSFVQPNLHSQTLLCLDNVSVQFENGHHIFRNIDFSIQNNRLTAICGVSGIGKSTLCKVILGLYRYQSGSIKLWGHELTQYGLCELRQNIAYVPQDNMIIEGTILENLLLGNMIEQLSQQEIDDAIKAVCADKWINLLQNGYETEIGEGGTQLSGGQRQSLGIARALLRRTPLILLDEAFAGIDEKTVERIMINLKTLTPKCAVVIVSHDEHVILRCDDIIDFHMLERNIT